MTCSLAPKPNETPEFYPVWVPAFLNEEGHPEPLPTSDPIDSIEEAEKWLREQAAEATGNYKPVILQSWVISMAPAVLHRPSCVTGESDVVYVTDTAGVTVEADK